MKPSEVLLESKWNLSVGTELSSPTDRELAVVRGIADFDLNDDAQNAEFQRQLNHYMSVSGSRRGNPDYPSVINLNVDETGEDRYAHCVVIEVIAGTRRGKRFMYVVYDNNENKVWSNYAGTTDRNVDLSRPGGKEKLARILSVNMLPVEPTMNGEPPAETRGVRAANYWQVVDIGATSVRARDRIKPNQLSTLANTEREMWERHPVYQAAIEKYNLARESGDREAIKIAKAELATAADRSKRVGPTDEMLGPQSSMNASNIVNLVATSKARSSGRNKFRSFFPARKKEYLTELINKFIENPNNPNSVFPMTIVDNVDPRSTMTNIGIGNAKSVTTDFMEIVHPIAVTSGNVTGNARNMILEFLGARSYEELMKTATISYGGSNTEKLVDSYVFNKGKNGTRKILLSSKSNKGSPASVKSLEVAKNEVLKNPQSKKMWEREVEQNDEYGDALLFLDTIIKNKDYSWQGATEFASEIGLIENQDRNTIAQLAAALGKNVKDNSETDNELNEARNTGVDITQFYNQFSPELKDIYDDSRYIGKNDVWEQLIGGLWDDIITFVNKSTAFGNIVVWLFNHSATIQVNTRTQEQTKNGVKRLTLNNIVATWPTQLVETAQLTLGASGGASTIKFSLDIDGYNQVLGEADIAAPLSNRQDIKSMPRGDNPQRPDALAKMGADDEVLTSQEKRDRNDLAMQRRIGGGTDNFYLPPKNDRETPDGSPSAEREPRQTRQSRQNTQQSLSPSVTKMTQFLNKYHIDDQTATPASSYRFVIKVLNDSFKENLANISNDFRLLMSDPTIGVIIKRDTIDSIKHPANIMNEAGFDDVTVVHSITLMYWALTFKRYLEMGYNSSTPQYAQVRDTLLKLGTNLIRDGGTKRKFISTVTNLDRKANTSSAMSSNQRFATAFQTGKNNPQFVQLWNKLTPTQKNGVKDSMIGFYEENQGSAKNDLEELLYEIQSTLGLRESRILKISRVLKGILG